MAVDLLSAVMTDRRPFDDALERIGAEDRYASIEPRDRAFARAIAATALRRHGQLADIIKRFIEKPLPEKRGRLDAILLCAAAQLVFLKSPPHAVINLSVFQVQDDPQARRFSRLANAVLRRVSEQGATLAAQQDAGKLNTPDWLWQSWSHSFGPDEAERIAAQHLREPPLDLTVKSDAEDWARQLGGVVLPTGSVRLAAKGRIEELAGFSEGEWWVQDAGASLPAKFLGEVAGKRVADLCAAPGGKTAQLAHAGALVVAIDSSAKRLERLKDNLARLRLDAEIVTADALNWQPEEPLDAVLLDAPCSATGTIRRNPDIPYLKRPSDINELSRLQQNMLGNAMAMLKPGGVLVYCTCSLEAAEGPDQIARLLAIRDDVRISPIAADEIGGRTEWIDRYGALRTLPNYLQLSDPELTGMDGFYAARLVKS
ncbi:RsmB/NOP family class I SAM-dependent RNA methyltransferase [Rhodomicrobium sp. R_RK_3]|nr:RsmB/NOP family class I SAM-dependent RNA methyltransferase [Rhodomicrobium sp. R_RK_3]